MDGNERQVVHNLKCVSVSSYEVSYAHIAALFLLIDFSCTSVHNAAVQMETELFPAVHLAAGLLGLRAPRELVKYHAGHIEDSCFLMRLTFNSQAV